MLLCLKLGEGPSRKRGRPRRVENPLQPGNSSALPDNALRPQIQDATSVEENEPLSSTPASGTTSTQESQRLRRSIDRKKGIYAQVWGAEFTGRHVGPGPKGYSICYGKGKVQLPLLREPPLELGDLISSGGQRSRGYFNKSRVYNNIFAFCSFGGNVDHSVNNGKGPFVFRVSGRTYHSIGSLVPPDGLSPKFAQLYMYDAQEAVTHRINFPGKMGEVDPTIMVMLQEMLERDNALVGMFKQLRHRFTSAHPEIVGLRILERRTTDGRFENLPTANDYEFVGLVVC
ncbi:ATP-dependent DNA helicase PIF1 [Heracleum sosnowskyi]|uniref:ATP-dependent DNA helicase PIF1 n=1 Tax=Heracleum sosnowskyi TaxID=360622 RepID=A0AAD8J330_9APIA|nr:ATP-dependent DNA helicase PIF1 [Heracleum sosnowskyi]